MEQANSTPILSDVISSEMDKDNSTLPITNEETTKAPVTETQEVAPTETKTEVEESFTPFNPNDLTPEMQAVYKRWQSDYTQKRQGEKAKMADYEQRLAKYEQSSGTQTQKVEDFNQAKATGEIDKNMSFQDYSRLLIDQAKQEFKNEIKTDQENEYIGNQEKEFITLDPRFQEGPGFDKVLLNHVASELKALRDSYETENGTIIGFDFINQAKQLISEYDNRIQESNKAFVLKQNEIIKNNSVQSSKANPNARNVNGQASGTMNLADAFDKAYSTS